MEYWTNVFTGDVNNPFYFSDGGALKSDTEALNELVSMTVDDVDDTYVHTLHFKDGKFDIIDMREEAALDRCITEIVAGAESECTCGKHSRQWIAEYRETGL